MDGEFGAWSGAMLSQALPGAPPGKPCTDVVINKVATMKYIKLAAYD